MMYYSYINLLVFTLKHERMMYCEKKIPRITAGSGHDVLLLQL